MMYYELLATQLRMNMNGMILLMVWAIVNILLGIVLFFRYKDSSSTKYFFQMNAIWNVINLLIAIGSMVMLTAILPTEIDLKATINTGFLFEKILLVNVGLDIAYVAIGSYLVEHGKRVKKVMYEGYGKALWLQGGFLFFLDIVLFLMNFYYNQQYGTFILF